MWFEIGDYFAGILIAVLTALAVRMMVAPGMDMVIAMLLGMGAGMVIHVIVGFAAAPFLGMFQTMMPGSLIGMYGGMMFGMRDSMAAGSANLMSVIFVGAILGAVIVAGVKLYDRALHRVVIEAGP
jgi:hypothetical protein